VFPRYEGTVHERQFLAGCSMSFAVTIMVAVLRLRFCVTDFDPICASRFVQNRRPRQSMDPFMPPLSAFRRLIGYLRSHASVCVCASALNDVRFISGHRCDGYLFGVIPKGFFPSQVPPASFCGYRSSQDIRFEAMKSINWP